MVSAQSSGLTLRQASDLKRDLRKRIHSQIWKRNCLKRFEFPHPFCLVVQAHRAKAAGGIVSGIRTCGDACISYHPAGHVCTGRGA